MSDFKPITIVGLNSKVEIEFDINLVMQMYHAYISYLPIDQRSPQEQLLLSKQMLVFQDLYNAEQKAAIEYIEKKADEEAVKQADVGPHYKNLDLEHSGQPCPLCLGYGVYEDGYGNKRTCARCAGKGIGKAV